MKVRLYGDPLLRQKAREVASFDGELRGLAEEMAVTLREAEGLGLAANQVGKLSNLFVLDWEALGQVKGWQAFVNPRILKAENERTVEEGCLSFPGIREDVKRFEKVWIKAQDLDRKPFESEAEGLLAQAFQHEIDHLNGVLFIDRMSAVSRDLLKGKLRDLASRRHRGEEEGERKRKADRGPEDRGEPEL